MSKENPKIAEKFGDDAVRQSCLLAVRLVEAGVRFVTVSLGGWDTHSEQLHTSSKATSSPTSTTGLAGLFGTLAERGLLDSTTVFVTGEFGRTPKINARAGRDHWPRAMFVLLAGGGMKGGQVIGASDERAWAPPTSRSRPTRWRRRSITAWASTTPRNTTRPTGRPVMIVREGTLIDRLF